MGKHNRQERADVQRKGATSVRPARSRLWQMAAAVIVVGVGVGIVLRSSRSVGEGATPEFTEVGREGMVFTVSVPKSRAADEEYLIRVAEQLSARDVNAGASGQISVMIWPDDVKVPKQPPTTEFDASMRTQAAGVFINPSKNIKHIIRFKDGQQVAEREFGKQVQ